MDLNCDMGELPELLATQEELLRYVTSVNIACGGHAGDEALMRATVEQARRAGAAIGAHPGYPDRARFGRLHVDMAPEAIAASVYEQIARLGGDIAHVKPHGALYNDAARDRSIARAIAEGAGRWSRDVVLVGLSGSVMLEVFREAGFRVAREAFADRAYEPDGTLRPRRLPGALIEDPEAAARQAVAIARADRADTICIHGDTPGAVRIAEAVARALREAGVTVAALRQ